MFRNHDWILTINITLLIVIGCITIYSITYLSDATLIYKQLAVCIIAFIAYFSLNYANYAWLKETKILAIVYFFVIALLIFVRFFTEQTAGTNRWIDLGIFNLQPAEIAKLMIVIICAHLLARHKDKLPAASSTIKPFQNLKSNESTFYPDIKYIKNSIRTIITALPILGLTLIQPSFGNTAIMLTLTGLLILISYPQGKFILLQLFWFMVAFAISFVVFDLKLKILIILLIACIWLAYRYSQLTILNSIMLILAGSLLIPAFNLGWEHVLKPYQRQRIETFLNPQSDPLGSGWQVRQSIIAIGSGRFAGRGLMQGTQASLGILPYGHTDFIFAAYAEQFGFIGSIILLTLLCLIPMRLFYLSYEMKSQYDQIILCGVGFMLTLHTIINIGMNLGKLPVTGIPLPFISYGGSALLVNMLGLGLVQNILKYNRELTNHEKILPRTHKGY